MVGNDLHKRQMGMPAWFPITDPRFPLYVTVSPGVSMTGFIMVEQVASVDFRSRKARHIDEGPLDLLQEFLGLLDASIH